MDKIKHFVVRDNNGNLSDITSDKTKLFDMGIREKWLSTEEASRYLSVTQNALRIMVHRKRVKAFKLGRRLRFRLVDLHELLSKREVIYG